MSHTFIPVAPSSLATEAYGHFLSTLFPLPTSQQKALCLPKGLTTPWPEPEEKGPPFPCLSTWATSELFPCYSLLERMSNIFMVYFFFSGWEEKDEYVLPRHFASSPGNDSWPHGQWYQLAIWTSGKFTLGRSLVFPMKIQPVGFSLKVCTTAVYLHQVHSRKSNSHA